MYIYIYIYQTTRHHIPEYGYIQRNAIKKFYKYVTDVERVFLLKSKPLTVNIFVLPAYPGYSFYIHIFLRNTRITTVHS